MMHDMDLIKSFVRMSFVNSSRWISVFSNHLCLIFAVLDNIPTGHGKV